MNHLKGHTIILLLFILLPAFLTAQVDKRNTKKAPAKEVKSRDVHKQQLKPVTVAPEKMKATTKVEPIFGTVADFKGREYKTHKVGNQWWIMESFGPTYNAYGMEIPYELPSAWGDPNRLIDGGYKYIAITQDQQTDQFMGLHPARYSDANPSGIQGLCPIGWHLPSLAEYEELFEHYGGRDVAAPKMREELGFGNHGYWTTSGSAAGIYFIELRDYTDQVQVFQNTGNYHHSIRCVKDD